MKTIKYSSLVFSIVFCSNIQAAQIDPNFAIDPASPSIDGNITPDDILMSGPLVFTQGSSLGLQDNFFSGEFDNLNALSYGKDPIGSPLFFSVDRVTVGMPGTAVNLEAQPGSEEAAGDIFQAQPPANNSLFIDEANLGLTPGFFGDDLDALDLDSTFGRFTYFSIDALSASNGFGAGDLANDILISDGSGTYNTFAEGITDVSLLAGDDLDALVLFDNFQPGILNPGIDKALFSLSTFSPSTFTFTGNPYNAGVQGSLSPADILFTDFTGNFTLWASAQEIGLLSDDEVNALDTVVPLPSSFLLFVSGLISLIRLNIQPKER